MSLNGKHFIIVIHVSTVALSGTTCSRWYACSSMLNCPLNGNNIHHIDNRLVTLSSCPQWLTLSRRAQAPLLVLFYPCTPQGITADMNDTAFYW